MSLENSEYQLCLSSKFLAIKGQNLRVALSSLAKMPECYCFYSLSVEIWPCWGLSSICLMFPYWSSIFDVFAPQTYCKVLSFLAILSLSFVIWCFSDYISSQDPSFQNDVVVSWLWEDFLSYLPVIYSASFWWQYSFCLLVAFSDLKVVSSYLSVSTYVRRQSTGVYFC